MLKNKLYVDIITRMANETFGEGIISVESDESDSRIHLSIMDTGYVFTFMTENGSYVINLPFLHSGESYSSTLYEIKYTSIELFQYLVSVVFDIKIKPLLVRMYQGGTLDTIPKGVEIPKIVYNLDNILQSEFSSIFNDITEYVSNSEKAEVVIITREPTKITIKFHVDCGRAGVHRDNTIKINNRGAILVYLCEYLAGGGIEDELEKKLLKIISEEKK